MELRCGLCVQCHTWHYVTELDLLWQESPGVLRGVCDHCNEYLEQEASKLDWDEAQIFL